MRSIYVAIALAFLYLGLSVLNVAGVGDLRADDIGFSPSPEQGIYVGQKLKVFVNITNNGTEAWDSRVDFYIDGKKIGEDETGNLTPGQPITLYITYTLQNEDEGDREFRVEIVKDDDNNDNNEVSENVYVNPATPDLMPAEVSFDRKLIVDTYVGVTIAIKNRGTASAQDVKIKFSQDQTVLVTEEIASVVEGSTMDVSSLIYLSSVGTFNFTVMVDYTDEIEEMKEDNNALTIRQRVYAPGDDDLPDFLIQVIEPPEAYVQGSKPEIRLNVWNNGTRGWSNRSVNVSAYIDDELVTWTYASMPANYYDEVVLSWRVLQETGRHNLTLRVDPGDQIDEVNETNNQVILIINITPPEPRDHPDLAISSNDIRFFVGGAELNESQSVREDIEVVIQVTVNNLGNMSAEDVPIYFYVDGDEIGNTTFDIGGLWNRPNTAVVLMTWTAVEGDHVIGVEIDPHASGAVNETDERGDPRRENNAAERHLTVVPGPMPDFYVNPDKMALYVDGEEVTLVSEDTNVTFRFSVKNIGEITGSCTALLYDSATPIPQEISGPLVAKFDLDISSGEEVIREVTWSINRSGYHYLRVRVLNASGADIDFSNNEAEHYVEVTGRPLPDLLITSMTLNTTRPLRNESVLINLTLMNNGTSSTDISFNVNVEITVSGKKYLVAVANVTQILAPGEVVSVEVIWDINYLPTGTYPLTAVADPILGEGYGRIEEIDEGNNIFETEVTIRPVIAPDAGIYAKDITVSQAWNLNRGEEKHNLSVQDLNEHTLVISGVNLVLSVPVHNEGTYPLDNISVNYTFTSLEQRDLFYYDEKMISFLDVGKTVFRNFTIQMPLLSQIELWRLKVAVSTTDRSRYQEKPRQMMNNYVDREVWVLPYRPDPAVVSITADPEYPMIFDEVRLTVHVRNAGPSEVPEAYLIVNYDGSSDRRNFSLAPGEHGNFTFVHTFTSEKSFLITATIEYEEDEIDTDNNRKEMGLNVGPIPQPEFYFIDLELPETLHEGDTVSIIVKIGNRGSIGAKDIPVRLLINGLQEGSDATVSFLGPGDFQTVSFRWTPQIGTYNITVVVNPDRTVEEHDYSNNHATAVVTVEKKPPEGGEERVSMILIVGVAGASALAGIGIFLLLRKK